jgi:hypothetical protein
MPVRKRRVGPAVEAGGLALQVPLKVGILIFKQFDVIAESKLPRIGRPLSPGKGADEGCRSKSMLGGNYRECFSSSLWQARQYLHGIAFRRLSGIGSPHSSQCVADSPAYIDLRCSSMNRLVICSILSTMASVPPAHAVDIVDLL